MQQGFEVGVHVSTDCADWTPASLADTYSSQLAAWRAKYASLPSPVSNRTHCIPESDYSTQPHVELANGIRLDTNYYYWPASWIQDRPGLFTGSGFPMRFADSDGSMIDVYQAATQMTDESGQSYPFTIDTLLDNALGSTGYYGVFTANMHTDSATSSGADAIVASAQARHVPIVSAAPDARLARRAQLVVVRFPRLERPCPDVRGDRRRNCERPAGDVAHDQFRRVAADFDQARANHGSVHDADDQGRCLRDVRRLRRGATPRPTRPTRPRR